MATSRLLSQGSYLSRLPPEIHGAIFETYFAGLEFQLLSKRNLNPSKTSDPLQCRSNVREGNALAILAVCQQLRQQALPYLGRASFIIIALFPGWHQASRDILGLPQVHADQIAEVQLRFLDSNFSLLQALPNLKRIYISPPGQLRCQRKSSAQVHVSNSCWSREEIDGEMGRAEMKSELAASLKMMDDLLDPLVNQVFDVHFSVAFKFLIEPLNWSHSGRLLSTRGNFYSVVRCASFPSCCSNRSQQCIAIARYDSKLGANTNAIGIQSVKPLLL